MRRLRIGAIILSVLLITGCSPNNSQAEYDSLMAEKQSLEAELEKQKETTIQEITESTQQTSNADIEIIFDRTYNIGDEDTMRFAVLNKEGQISLSVFATASDADNATIMFLASAGVLKDGDLDFSINIFYNELHMVYSMSDGKLTCVGTNTDGSMTLSAPDWINSNVNLATEANSQYYLDALKVVEQFTQDFTDEYGIEMSNDVSENQTDSQTKEIEVLAEYTLPDGIGWYTYHFMIVKNNTDKALNVKTSSKAYMADGTLVSVDDAEFDALGAGCVSVIQEHFETDSEIAYYDTKITSKNDGWCDSVIQDLSYTDTLIKDGAIFDVTNNGTKAAEFVEGYVLFFNGDELVDWDYSYFTDDDSELKPGETITKQLSCYKTFDRVEFYLDGRR
jgi:outer membrane murein-binding lipoprotein Lpp